MKRLLKGVTFDPDYRLPTGDTVFHTGDEEKEESEKTFKENMERIHRYEKEHERKISKQ